MDEKCVYLKQKTFLIQITNSSAVMFWVENLAYPLLWDMHSTELWAAQMKRMGLNLEADSYSCAAANKILHTKWYLRSFK